MKGSGFGKKASGSGIKKTTSKTGLKSGTKTGAKKRTGGMGGLSNILRINPLGLRPTRSKNAMPEDAEILHLQKMLGLKSNKDLSSLMGEFADDGLDDFLDLIFDESTENGLEDDGTKLERPQFDPNKMETSGISLEEFMGIGQGSDQGSDSDPDQHDEVMVGSKNDIKGEKKIEKHDRNQKKNNNDNNKTSKIIDGQGYMMGNNDDGYNTLSTIDKNPAQKGKMRTLLEENSDDDDDDSSDESSDDDNNDVTMNDDDELLLNDKNNKNSKKDDKNNKKVKTLTDTALMNALSATTTTTSSNTSTTQSTNQNTQKLTQNTIIEAKKKFVDRYVPPHIRKRLGIDFDRVAMRESYAKYLSQNESFIDVKNNANSNAYIYHGIMTDINQHKELYIQISAKLNKLSHLNVAHIFAEFIDDFIFTQDIPIGTLIDLIIYATTDFCTNQRSILSSTVQALGVLCASFHKVFGTSFGSLMIETFTTYLNTQLSTLYQQYVDNYAANFTFSKHGVIYLAPTDIKPLLNLVDVIGVMYMMSCVPHKFVLGLCDWLLTSNTLFEYQGKEQNKDKNDTKNSKTKVENNDKKTLKTSTTSVTKLNDDIRWIIQCTLISHILLGFGLQLRKDDAIVSKQLFQQIIEKSSGYEGNWTTQELLAVINDVKSNKQHVPMADESIGNKKGAKDNNMNNANSVDYASLHESLYGSMNYILENYTEDLLEKGTDVKKGRRETKRQQLKKQLALLKDAQNQKKSISTKFLTKNLLNVTYNDILRVKDTGRWWVVGAGFKQTQNIMEESLQRSLLDNPDAQRSLLDDSGSDNDDSDDEDVLHSVNVKKIAKECEKLNFNSPLEKYIFSSLSRCVDYIEAYTLITSKHSNHIHGSGRSNNNNISIAPSMYAEVVNVIIQTAITQPQYNQLYALLLGKLLFTYSAYRFPTCTKFWDIIQSVQVSFMDIKRDIDANNSIILKSKRAPVSAQANVKAAVAKAKAKLTELQQKNAELTIKTSNLSKLIADLITQPCTLDLYILRKMAFTPMMYVQMIEGDNMESDDDDDNDGGDDKKGDKANNNKDNKTMFGAVTISANDINSMNDNTILFMHKLLEQICEKLCEFDDNIGGNGMANVNNDDKSDKGKKGKKNEQDDKNTELIQHCRNLIVPLQAPELTNYNTMDKDLLKLQFTTLSKYDKVKQQQNGVEKKKINFDGKRILSCIIESLQNIMIPMVDMEIVTLQQQISASTKQNSQKDDKIVMSMKDVDNVEKLQKAHKMKRIAQLLLKTAQRDNIMRK